MWGQLFLLGGKVRVFRWIKLLVWNY
jgi:hypothetical protein